MKFPAKISNFNCSEYNTIFSKGSRFSITAFLLLFIASLLTACESPGPVGDDIISDDEPVKSQTEFIQDYTVVQENSFSGRLANTAVGYFEDPVFGTINSVALLKPAINNPNIEMIGLQDTISLQLIFDDVIYGDSLATSAFEIYKAGEIWRGAELRYNEEIPIDQTNKIAEFRVEADEDSVVVDLSRAFMIEYSSYFNTDDDELTSAERDSVYIYNFPGLAIVPSESNRNIRFLKNLTDNQDTVPDDEESITSFLLKSPAQDDEEEDEDESGPVTIDVRDWGSSTIRSSEPDYSGNIVLHNTERILKIDLDLPIEELESKSIVNAQLILTKNEAPLKNAGSIARPNTNFMRAHVFDDEPLDVMAEIFTIEPSFGTSLSDTSNTFLLNITQHVLNEVYGDADNRTLYISIESINGLFYSTYFFDSASADINKPRVVITYVEE